ncbi:MAG: DNA translocase FtsK [Actinobacteria bacterium]|nr:DNA translocase FtsK [Actinomycetota bacterium]MCL6087361.1 DNA translocase FtsK [Actinomycetota bacterium]
MTANNIKHNKKSQSELSKKKYKTDETAAAKNYIRSRRELYGIIIIMVSILFFISLFVKGESGVVLKYINYFLSYLFGVEKYIFSLLILAWGIGFFIKKSSFFKIRLSFGSLLFFLSLSGLLAISSNINNIFDEIFIRSHGGITGSGIYYGFFKITNKAGAVTILSFLLIISLLIITNVSLIEIIRKISEGYREKRQKRLEEGRDKEVFPHSEKDSIELSGDKDFVKVKYIENIEQDLNDSAYKKNGKITAKFPFITDHVKKSTLNAENEVEIKDDVLMRTMPEKTGQYTKQPATKISKESQLEMSIPQEESEDANYKLPPESLLKKSKTLSPSLYKQDIKENIFILNNLFRDFNLAAKVSSVVRGPSVTLYELTLSPGVKVQRLLSLEDDFCVALGSSDIRILTPIPGKSAIGIEVPNKIKSIVTLGDVYSLYNSPVSKEILRVPLGKNLSGDVVYMDINHMPHLLIAGATNSGKSSCINSIVISLLLKIKPSEVKFIMIDPKMVELSIYNGIPHLLAPVVVNPKKASTALSWAVDEMENRLKVLSDYNCKNLEQFNSEVEKNKSRDPHLVKLPYVLIIIDELADLMIVSASEVEESINRIAQMGRAVGIHLIIATQRPSVNVITGVIKANIPSRIAFNVASNTDSRVILDIPGAEKLIGRGDMLYSPVSFSRPERIQGAFVTTGEIEIITDYIKDQKGSSYLKDIFEADVKIGKKEMEDDPLIYEALEVFIEFAHASASLLQRRLRIGYSRAARIVDQLENRGFISGYDGAKPREVLISREDFLKFKKDMGMDRE